MILTICVIVVGVVNLLLLLTLASFLFRLGGVVRDIQGTVDLMSRTYVVDDEDVVATWVARQGMTRQALHVSSDVLIWKPLLEGPVPPRSVGQYSLAVGSRVCGWVRQQCGV